MFHEAAATRQGTERDVRQEDPMEKSNSPKSTTLPRDGESQSYLVSRFVIAREKGPCARHDFRLPCSPETNGEIIIPLEGVIGGWKEGKATTDDDNRREIYRTSISHFHDKE